jgi:hypothetical protein
MEWKLKSLKETNYYWCNQKMSVSCTSAPPQHMMVKVAVMGKTKEFMGKQKVVNYN